MGIVNSEDISVGKVGKRSSLLSIEAVTYGNAGNYTCLARNKAGVHAHSAELLVNGYFVLFNFF